MAKWGIAEWYGKDIQGMDSSERQQFAQTAQKADDEGIDAAQQPICPFLSTVIPDARCHKSGGVCSIRPYEGDTPIPLTEEQPTTVCPSRFLEQDNGRSLFAQITDRLLDVSSGAKVIKEVPFLSKLDSSGAVRGAKAGRIDWVVVPQPPKNDTDPFDWIAVETQAVYFSGGKVRPEFDQYAEDPSKVHAPIGNRRPDFRSSGAKRLVPQLDTKSPVMRRWGKKVVVVVDRAFANEFARISLTSDDFHNAEIAIYIVRFTEDWQLTFDELILTELNAATEAIQATAPMKKTDFEDGLRAELIKPRRGKVHDA